MLRKSYPTLVAPQIPTTYRVDFCDVFIFSHLWAELEDGWLLCRRLIRTQKTKKQQKFPKKSTIFCSFWQKTGHLVTKLGTGPCLTYIYSFYTFVFIKLFQNLIDSKIKIVPTTTITLTVPWSGLRRRQKLCVKWYFSSAVLTIPRAMSLCVLGKCQNCITFGQVNTHFFRPTEHCF